MAATNGANSTKSRSLNPSTALAKQLSKAAGESLVTYRLSRRGWLVVNANSGVQNMPNFDLIAMKDDHRITVQVKTGRHGFQVALAGNYREDGQYFNTKDGPAADVIAFVRLDPNEEEDDVFFVPVDVANEITRQLAEAGAEEKRSRGSSTRFPVWCRIKGNTQSTSTNAAKNALLPYRDADLI